MDPTEPPAADRQRVVSLRDLVRVPVRRWRTGLAGAALVAVAGVGYLTLVDPTYTATCVVVVRPVVIDPFSHPAGGADRAVNMTAENGVATGNAVIDHVVGVTGGTADEVRDALDVQTVVGGQVLRFDFAAATQPAAVAGANAAAAAYLRVRADLYEGQRAALLASYDGTLAQLDGQRRAARKGLPATLEQNTTSPSAQAVLDQLRAMNEQLVRLAEQRSKVASAELSPGLVTGEARQPVPASHAPTVPYLLAVLLGGVLLGVLGCYAREAFDRRVRSIAQVCEVTGVPVLGFVRARRRRGGAPSAADFRYVALAAEEWMHRLPVRRLVVLSSRGDEGRAQVAGGIAIALAEAGRNVYLGGDATSMDELRAALRAAQHHRPVTPGRTPPEPAVFQPPAREVAHRYAGAASGDNPTDPIIGLTFSRLVDTAGSAVPATGPAGQPIGAGTLRLGPFEQLPADALVVSDAPAADTDERGVRAAQCGVAVLVVALDRTRFVELTRLVARMRAAGVDTIGVVVTGGPGD